MLIKVVIIAVLAVLYGLAWHNQPAQSQDSGTREKEEIVKRKT